MTVQPASTVLSTSVVCPACRESLSWSSEDATCSCCGRSFTVSDGIPVFVDGERADHKSLQAAYFDDVEPEFEITRPHGTPRFYSWLIDEKLRRSVDALLPVVHGATALSVCGGSGMEAEFLARRGARVMLADISLGAVRRAQERARRFGFEVTGIVADAERLPFADRSFDIAYVHDGLHHLEQPLASLAEMARVAQRAVSVNEPARAAATALAVRLGLSDVEEEAGNVIERLEPGLVVDELERAGFEIVRSERYAMVYRHEPGRASQVLSAPLVFPLARGAIRGFNVVAGRLGNKLTVQAVRI
jgi:ubiquinone/menaquinone biosynthesis C-methylase UbiE